MHCETPYRGAARSRSTCDSRLSVGHGVNVGAHHPDFVVLFVEILEEDVAQGDDADQAPLMADREMTKIVTAHERHTIFDIFVHAHSERIVGHDFSDAGRARVAAFGNHALHQIAFGENSDQLAIVKNRNGSDVVLDHGTDGFQDAVTQFSVLGFLTLDQIADAHGILPSVAAPKGTPGGEYMPKSDAGKEGNSWEKQINNG